MNRTYVSGFKGCVTDKLPMMLKPDELVMAMNMNLENDGSLSQREGSELLNTFGNKASLLTFYELRDGVAYKHIIVIEDRNLYMYDGSTFTTVYTNLNTSGDKWDGNAYVNTFVFSNQYATYSLAYDSSSSSYVVTMLSCDFCNDGTTQIVNISIGDIVFNHDGDNINGTDLTYYKAVTSQTGIGLSTEDYTDTTKWSEVGLKPEAAAGESIEQFDNRLFMAGDGTENLYWSNQGDPVTWDVLDFIAMGAMVTALKTVGEFLFVGTNKGLYKLSTTGDSTLPYAVTMITEDAILHHGLVEVTTGVVGGITNDGNFIMFDQYAKEGSEVSYKAGLPIRDYLLNVNGDDLQIATFENRVIITCNLTHKYLSTTGSNNNAQLVLNNTIFGWTFYNLPMFTVVEYDGDLYYSDYTGNVYKLNSSLHQDNGVDFDTYLITAVIDDSIPEIVKSYRRVFLVARPKTKTTIKLYWNLNFSIEFSDNRETEKEIYASDGYWGTTTWGEFIWGGIYAEMPTYRIDSTGKGIQLKIERSSSDSDLKIQGFSIEYQPAYIKGTNY